MKRTLYFDEDSDARFYQFEAGTMTKFDLDAILENLSKTSVGVYIVGINAQIANYRSRVFQSYLDGFDILQGPYQKVLRGDANHWSFRRRANMARRRASACQKTIRTPLFLVKWKRGRCHGRMEKGFTTGTGDYRLGRTGTE